MQYFEKTGSKMQCIKLICMSEGYCPFKMDLSANMQSQKVKTQCSMQNEKIKPRLLQFRGSDSKYEKTEGPRMQFYMVKCMHLNRLI